MCGGLVEPLLRESSAFGCQHGERRAYAAEPTRNDQAKSQKKGVRLRLARDAEVLLQMFNVATDDFIGSIGDFAAFERRLKKP